MKKTLALFMIAVFLLASCVLFIYGVSENYDYTMDFFAYIRRFTYCVENRPTFEEFELAADDSELVEYREFTGEDGDDVGTFQAIKNIGFNLYAYACNVAKNTVGFFRGVRGLPSFFGSGLKWIKASFFALLPIDWTDMKNDGINVEFPFMKLENLDTDFYSSDGYNVSVGGLRGSR